MPSTCWLSCLLFTRSPSVMAAGTCALRRAHGHRCTQCGPQYLQPLDLPVSALCLGMLPSEDTHVLPRTPADVPPLHRHALAPASTGSPGRPVATQTQD